MTLPRIRHLLTSSLIASGALLTVPTHAYTPMTTEDCDVVTWPSNPRVILHLSELVGFTGDMEDDLIQAMEDIHAELGATGGTTAAIAGFTLSTAPFTFRTPYNDAVPTIHVGFTSDEDEADGAAKVYKDNGRCEITSANIQFLNPSETNAQLVDWRFGEPADEGEDYWLADHNLNTSAYFRISYVHELLHAWGLKHSPDSYSMLNYSTRPFLNRVEGRQVRPLPDDVEFLRDFYPNSASTRSLGITNTWYTPSEDLDEAADQDGLCAPAKGDAWDDWNAPHCATNPTTQVCPGEWVRTQSAIANYGTELLSIEHRLWFSRDATWTTSDLASPTVRTYDVRGNVSSKQGRMFQVPTNARHGTTYYLIARVTGTDAGGFVRNDWIPLRGQIAIKSLAVCGDMSPVPLPGRELPAFED